MPSLPDVRGGAVVLSAAMLVAGCGSSQPTPSATVAVARAELRAVIEDVTASTAHRYHVTDDQGHGMDTAKIIWSPEADAFVAVYHTWSETDGRFHVHLATSEDLLAWTWQVELASLASQPTIARVADGSYVMAWEQEPDPIHMVLASFRTWADLQAGVPARHFDVPITMPACGEGTPSIEAATPDRVDLAFHYHADCELDREAGGSTDWTHWLSSARPAIDQALRDQGVTGHIGDRDRIAFDGHDLTLIEGQLVYEAPGSTRIFLYDGETGGAEAIPFRTHAGSVAFSNPTIERIVIDGKEAILVALFVLGEGAAGVEDGELIYYRTLPVDDTR